MIALTFTVLFATATVTGLCVTATALLRAWASYGQLRQALAECDTTQVVEWRIRDTGYRSDLENRKLCAARLRLVSNNRPVITRVAELPAAA